MTPLTLPLGLAPKSHTGLMMWAAGIFVGTPVFITEHEIMIKFCLESNRLSDIPPHPHPLCWLDFNLGNYIQLPKFQYSLYGSVSLLVPIKAVLAREDCGIRYRNRLGCLSLACEVMSLC